MLEVNLKPLGFGVSYHRALGTACGPLDSSVSNLWGLVFHIIGFWSDHQTLEYHQIWSPTHANFIYSCKSTHNIQCCILKTVLKSSSPRQNKFMF